MITIDQRNWKVFNDDDTVSKLSKIHFLEFACFTLPFPPFHESFTVWKVSFTGDKQFTNEQISNVNSLHKSKILVLSTIPLLCRIWPGFKQKSSLFLPTKSWNDTNTCALIFLFSLDFPWWQDQNYSSANHMHCSAKLCHCSQIHIHNFFRLSGWA